MYGNENVTNSYRNGELVNADTMLNNGVNYYYRLK